LINIIVYCVAVWIANYTATMFIPLPVFGMVSVGTLVFGITFTQRDRVHKHGRLVVYAMIAFAAMGMVIESVFLAVSWRIIFASFIAIILSETADTEVYQRFIQRSWLQRVVLSNAVSIPIDSIFFNAIAFWSVFPVFILIQIIFGEIIVKALTGLLVSLWKHQN